MKPSRAMIPAEVSWAYIALVFAWSGSGLWPFESSYLHKVLARDDGDTLWTVVIGLPAILLMIASLREYIAHRWPKWGRRNWSMIDMDISARIRGRLCFALAFSWAYVVYAVLMHVAGGLTVLSLALGGFAFMLFSWVENRRVQRDIKKQTIGFSVRA